jgi:hypothetical protein
MVTVWSFESMSGRFNVLVVRICSCVTSSTQKETSDDDSSNSSSKIFYLKLQAVKIAHSTKIPLFNRVIMSPEL